MRYLSAPTMLCSLRPGLLRYGVTRWTLLVPRDRAKDSCGLVQRVTRQRPSGIDKGTGWRQFDKGNPMTLQFFLSIRVTV